MYIAFPILDLRLSRFLKVETYFWKLSFNVAMPCQWSQVHCGFQQTKVFLSIRLQNPPNSKYARKAMAGHEEAVNNWLISVLNNRRLVPSLQLPTAWNVLYILPSAVMMFSLIKHIFIALMILSKRECKT